MRTALLLLIVLASSCAGAADVYKCKGAKGETIYSNQPCAKPADTLGHGTYAPAPDNPQQLYDAENDAYRRQAGAAQAQVGSTYVPPQAVMQNAAIGRPSAYSCSANGRTWIQSTPCPSSTLTAKPAIVSGMDSSGQPFNGMGTVIDPAAPVQQQALSHDDLCRRLRAKAAVSEHGQSGPSSAYDRNKMRQADGC